MSSRLSGESVVSRKGWGPCCDLCFFWMVAERPSNTLVYPRDGSTRAIVRAATLKQKWRIKLFIKPSHSILTPGQPVPARALYLQELGRVGTRTPIYLSLVYGMSQQEKAGFSSAVDQPCLDPQSTCWQELGGAAQVFFFFCGRSVVLRPPVHMLAGIGWCGASLLLLLLRSISRA